MSMHSSEVASDVKKASSSPLSASDNGVSKTTGLLHVLGKCFVHPHPVAP